MLILLCLLSLKRMVFNFDTMVEDKLHSRFEFDKTLNVAAFANSDIVDEPAAGAPAGGADHAAATVAGAGGAGAGVPAGDGDDMSDDAGGDGGGETSPGPAVPADFYEYNLSGIVCHTGETARAGHYYSFIRDRETGAWNEFNDSIVKPFDYDNEVASRCFGGKVEAASQGWETVGQDASTGAVCLAFLTYALPLSLSLARFCVQVATNAKNERVASAYILVYERKLWDAPPVPAGDPASGPAEQAATAGGGDNVAFGSGGASGVGASDVTAGQDDAGDESKASGPAAADVSDDMTVEPAGAGGTSPSSDNNTAFVKELLELVQQGENTQRQAVQRVVPPLIFQAVYVAQPTAPCRCAMFCLRALTWTPNALHQVRRQHSLLPGPAHLHATALWVFC